MIGGTHCAAAQGLSEASGKVPGPVHAAPPAAPPLQAPGARAAAICSAVAVALWLQELEHLRALELLPTPAALLDRLRARAADFDLLAGVAGAYLRERGVADTQEVR
ncbi:MAG: hypothetical protein P4L36_13170 [Holophaga sp.]|nr:hypothetical protein [Holophaga sp.]